MLGQDVAIVVPVSGRDTTGTTARAGRRKLWSLQADVVGAPADPLRRNACGRVLRPSLGEALAPRRHVPDLDRGPA